jgi:CRP-like cAMP-binding protein
MCIHWAACGWNLLRNGEAAQQAGDRSYQEMVNQYLSAIYFMQTAVVTLGYGDTVPETTREVIFVTFTMTWGFVAQAALVGHLITLLKHRLGKRAWYRSSLMQLKQYCLIHDLSPAVTRRLFHYSHYLWQRQKGLNEQQLLLNDFPNIYMQEFGVDVTLEIFAKIPFMCQDGITPPAGFLRALVPFFLPETFVPQITILQQGVSNSKLFLVLHGQVEQILDDIDEDVPETLRKPTVNVNADAQAAAAGFTSNLVDRPLSGLRSKQLSAGSFFGHDSFLVPFNSIPYTYLSTTYVDLFSLDREHFRHCLASYPKFEAEVNEYVHTMYANSEELQPTERSMTLNSNVSARMRRIRREIHINKLKKIFAKRQKSRRYAAKELARRTAASSGGKGTADKKTEVDHSVVKPHSVLHIMLQTFSFCCLVYFMVSLPLRVGFSADWISPNEFLSALLVDYIIDAWFWCEMILRMWKIALIDELNPHDPLLTDGRLILWTYVHSYAFLLDLISLVPLDLIPLLISYRNSDYQRIHLTYVCLVRFRVFARLHRFFQYFQSATFTITLLFDQSGLVELNQQTGGFGGAGPEQNQSVVRGEANDLLQMESSDGSVSESEDDETLMPDASSPTGVASLPKLSRRKSLGLPPRNGCLAKLNSPHSVLSHSYHTRTSLLILRLLILIGFFLHVSSCFFYYIARLEGVPDYAINADGSSNDTPDELSPENVCVDALCGKTAPYSPEESYNWAWRAHVWENLATGAIQYVNSMMWALETCSTIGFGTITPITSAETLYTFVFTMVGSTAYLVMLGFLTVLVDAAFQNSHSFQQGVACADHFIQKQSLPTTLRLRIHTYLHYLHFLQSGKPDEKFLENLPPHLRLDVVSYLCLPIVTSCPLFTNIELGALERVLLALEPVGAGPMDVLLMQGEVSNKIVLIQKGSVDVSINPTADDEDAEGESNGSSKAAVALPVLKGGNYFNERCLLVLGPSSANYVALSFCHLFTLSKKNFDAAISNYRQFKSAVRDRRDRVKRQEKAKVDALRRKVEQMEKQQLQSQQQSNEAILPQKDVPAPPPVPPQTPAPAASVSATPIPSPSALAAPADETGQMLRALKKQRQQEKMAQLREKREEEKKRSASFLTRAPSVHRQPSTVAASISPSSPRFSRRQTTGSLGDVAGLTQTRSSSSIISPVTAHRRNRASLHDFATPVSMADSSSSDSEAEQTRVRMTELKRRNTILRHHTSAIGTTTGVAGAPAATPPMVHALPVSSSTTMRDLELNITRRLHAKSMSVQTFLSTAEKDASEEIYTHESAKSPSKDVDDADTLKREQDEEMSQALMALSGQSTTMEASADPATGTAAGPRKGLRSSAASTADGGSFDQQTLGRSSTTFSESVVRQSLLARAFWYLCCCSTGIFDGCFRSCCRRGSPGPPRIYPPTSIFRVLWNVVSMMFCFYWMLIIPFRCCIGMFPTDSVMGTRGMNERGHIAHSIPASITLAGQAFEFDGMIIWTGTDQQVEIIQTALWVIDLLLTIFWMIDIMLRCKYFPLFVHHQDGLSGMRQTSSQSASLNDARSIQRALHDASGQTTASTLGAPSMSIAKTLLHAKKAFRGGRAANNLLSAHHPLQRAHTIEKHYQASSVLAIQEHPSGTTEAQEAASSAPPVADSSSEAPSPEVRKTEPSQPPAALSPPVSTAIFDAYYASGTLKWDLLGTIPFDLAFGLWYPEAASVLRLARLARIHRIFQYVQLFENCVEFYAVRINPVLLRIVEQFLVLLFTIHFFGCAWFLIGRFEFIHYGIASTTDNASVYSVERNVTVTQPLQVTMPTHFDNTHGWLSEEAFSPMYSNLRTLSNLYLFSIYYVLVCISTVGFGDIVAHTTIEILFTFVLILFGTLVYSFVTANIASLASNLDVSAEAFGEKLDGIKRFMNARGLPIPLQKKIHSFYREQWNVSKGYDEETLMSDIPHYLKRALVYTMHEGLLHHHVLFHGLEENFLIELSMALRYVLVIAGQVILQKGEVSLDMFLIRKGSVHVLLDSGVVLDELNEGGSFNEGAIGGQWMEEVQKHDQLKKRRQAIKDASRTSAPEATGSTSNRRTSLGSLLEIAEEPHSASSSPAASSHEADTASTLAPMSLPPSSVPSSVPLPTIRQLYAVVAVSHSVDLYTLHQRTVEEMCRLYPTSSQELKRRWREKTASKESIPDGDQEDIDSEEEDDSEPRASDSSFIDVSTGGAPAAGSSPRLHRSAASMSLHVHQHSHRAQDGITAISHSHATQTQAHADPMVHNIQHRGTARRRQRNKSLALRLNTFTSGRHQRAGSVGAARLLHPTPVTALRSFDPYHSTYDAEAVERERSRVASALFGSTFIWREGTMERLRWSILSLVCLLVHCWTLPIFISFTQTRTVTLLATGAVSSPELNASSDVFWVFLAIAFTVDLFFLIDWYMQVRHFASERQLNGVHWRHYCSQATMTEKLREHYARLQHVQERFPLLHPAAPPTVAAPPQPSVSSLLRRSAQHRLSTKVSDAACIGGVPMMDTASITETSTRRSSHSDERLERTDSRKMTNNRQEREHEHTEEAADSGISESADHLNPNSYTTLSTLPFHMDAFPATSNEITYSYFHQVGAWYLVPFDLIAVLPMAAVALFVLLGRGSTIDFTLIAVLGLNRVLLLLRVSPYLTALDSYLDRVDHLHVSFQSRRIIKYGILILFIVHWVSCGWLLFGSTAHTSDQVARDVSAGRQSEARVTWMMLMKEGQVQQLSQWHQYLYSVYWAITVISTSGWGDLTPTNPGEVVFTMVVILVGNLIYGSIIGAVTTSTANASASVAEHFERLHSLTHYLKHRRVSPDLMEKTTTYHKHLWRTFGGVNDAAVIAQLPILLRKEVCFTLYGRYLAQVPFFPSHDVSFIANLSILLHPQLYLSGDLLTRKNDIGAEMYFLRSGRVRVFIYDPDELGGSLRKKITLQANVENRVPPPLIRTNVRKSTAAGSWPPPPSSSPPAIPSPDDADLYRIDIHHSAVTPRFPIDALPPPPSPPRTVPMPSGEDPLPADDLLDPFRLCARSGCVTLGESSFFEQSLRSASVRALTHCDVLVLSNDDFQALLANYPHYRRTIYQSFLDHANKTYTDKKVGTAPSAAGGQHEAPGKNHLSPQMGVFPAFAAEPAGSPSTGSSGSSLPATTTRKVYKLTPHRHGASASPAWLHPLSSSSSSASLGPVDDDSAGGVSTGGGAATTSSTITFAGLVKLLATASPTGGGAAQTSAALGGQERDSMHQLRPTFKRETTFQRMMHS